MIKSSLFQCTTTCLTYSSQKGTEAQQRYSQSCWIACGWQERYSETVLPFTALRDFFCSTGIVPGKAGNGFAGSFVNCTVTVLFTKPPAARMVSVGSGHQSPYTDYEHFSVPLEWYQSKPGSREASGMVNITVKRDSQSRRPHSSWPFLGFDCYYSIGPPFHWKNVFEALNGETVCGRCSSQWHFGNGQ